MKPKHQRLVFLVVTMVFLCASALLTLRAFRDNLVFFYSPSDVAKHDIAPQQLIRIGGIVEGLEQSGEEVMFNVTDGSAVIRVRYRGMLPSLFREGQGVVAEGYLKDAAHFEARTILAKHDETYMPREVVDALKRSGRWKGP